MSGLVFISLLIRAGRNSKAVQYGLNKTLYALNTEFSPFKVNKGTGLKGLDIPFIKEEAHFMKIAGNLPVGTRLKGNKARHILIGKLIYLLRKYSFCTQKTAKSLYL